MCWVPCWRFGRGSRRLLTHSATFCQWCAGSSGAFEIESFVRCLLWRNFSGLLLDLSLWNVFGIQIFSSYSCSLVKEQLLYILWRFLCLVGCRPIICWFCCLAAFWFGYRWFPCWCCSLLRSGGAPGCFLLVSWLLFGWLVRLICMWSSLGPSFYFLAWGRFPESDFPSFVFKVVEFQENILLNSFSALGIFINVWHW